MKTIILILAALPAFGQGISIGGTSSGGSGITSLATSCGISGGTITTTGTVVNSIATAAHNGSYAILTGDCGKSLTTNTAAAWTIVQAGTTGFEAGKYWPINNVGTGSLTITATTSTFYGGPSANISGSVLTVPALTSATIVSDGTNYQVLSGGGGSGSIGNVCTVAIGDAGAASPVLANDNGITAGCGNSSGSNVTITSVSCRANAGSPTVTPILTAGTSTSILTGALTCGTAAWAAGTLNGTPVLHSFSADGATCASTPCTLDAAITSAGGTAKQILMRFTWQ